MDDSHLPPDDDTGRIGIFPSWAAVYWAVVLYTLGLIALLWYFTVAFDHSVR